MLFHLFEAGLDMLFKGKLLHIGHGLQLFAAGGSIAFSNISDIMEKSSKNQGQGRNAFIDQ